MEFEYEYQRALSVMEEVKKAVTGKDQCIEKAFAAIKKNS